MNEEINIKQAYYDVVKETLEISNKARELLLSVKPIENASYKEERRHYKGYFEDEEKLIKEAKKCLKTMATVSANLQLLKDFYDKK